MHIDLAVQRLLLGNWQGGSNCAVSLGVAMAPYYLPKRSQVMKVDSSCHDMKTIQTDDCRNALLLSATKAQQVEWQILPHD